MRRCKFAGGSPSSSKQLKTRPLPLVCVIWPVANARLDISRWQKWEVAVAIFPKLLLSGGTFNLNRTYGFCVESTFSFFLKLLYSPGTFF